MNLQSIELLLKIDFFENFEHFFQKIGFFEKWPNFIEMQIHQFLCYDNVLWCKSILFDHVNPFRIILRWRAHLRARYAHIQHMLWNAIFEAFFTTASCMGAQRARKCAHANIMRAKKFLWTNRCDLHRESLSYVKNSWKANTLKFLKFWQKSAIFHHPHYFWLHPLNSVKSSV